jgi:hypothetical protein
VFDISPEVAVNLGRCRVKGAKRRVRWAFRARQRASLIGTLRTWPGSSRAARTVTAIAVSAIRDDVVVWNFAALR